MNTTDDRTEARQVARWVLNDNFAKLEEWEDENGSITLYLDSMWDQFADDQAMARLLERAYNKWCSEY